MDISWGGMAARQVYDGDRTLLVWLFALLSTLLFTDLHLALHAPSAGFLQPLPLATGMILPIPIFLFVVFRRSEASNVLGWFGTISYPLYLLQDLALYGMLPVNNVFAEVYPVGVFAVAIAIATLVHRYVEEPAQAFGRKLARRQPSHGSFFI